MEKVTTLLSIGAGFEQAHSIQRALTYGYRVVCVDGSKEAFFLQDDLPYFFQEQRQKNMLISIHHDLKDYKKLIEIAKEYNVKNTLPQPLGRIIRSLGQVNSHCNFKGISYEAAYNFTNKVRVNEIQSKYNLPHPKQYYISKVKIEESHNFGNIISRHTTPPHIKENLNYPLIIKPVHGSGSLGVIYVPNKEAFDESFAYSQKVSKGDDLIIEEYIDGIEFSVNLIVKGDNYKVIAVFEKEMSKLPYRQEIEYFNPISITKDEIKTIADCTFKLAKCLGIDNSLIQSDVIFSKDKKPYVIDIAGRPTGNSIHVIFKHYNISTIDIWFDTILEDKELYDIDIKDDDCISFRFFTLDEGIIDKVANSVEPNIIENTFDVKLGDKIETCTCGAVAMKHGYILANDKTVEKARKASYLQLNKYSIKKES